MALALLATFASAAHAQADEDAAHAADRARTAELNRGAASAVATRDRPSADGGPESYRAAQARYRQALADWRARVDACTRGYWDACR